MARARQWITGLSPFKSLLFQPFFPEGVALLLLTSLSDLYNSTNVMVTWKRREEPRQAVLRSH